jgi:HEAT repeat protein
VGLDLVLEVISMLGVIGDSRAVEPLIEQLERDNEVVEGARIFAAESLGDIGDSRAVEPLIRVLGDKSSIPVWDEDERRLLRREAVDALGEIGDARAVEPLIEALDDDGGWEAGAYDVCDAAKEALKKLGHEV